MNYVLRGAQAANWDAYGRNPKAYEVTGSRGDANRLDQCVYFDLRPNLESRTFGSQLEQIRAIARGAMGKGCGNCREMASSAFVFLLDRGVRPIELMYATPDGADHMFACVGRPRNAPLDVRQWGADCWFIDPWMAGFTGDARDGAFPARDIGRMKQRVPKMEGIGLWHRED